MRQLKKVKIHGVNLQNVVFNLFDRYPNTPILKSMNLLESRLPMEKLQALLSERFQIVFSDTSLLDTAFTHTSYANEHRLLKISFRRITLPMLKNAFFSGIVYSFTKAITAVSAVIFLVSPRWKLVTSNIYSLFDLAKYGQAAAFVTMMVGILLVFIGLFNTVINLLLAPRSKVPQAKSKTEESK